MLDLTGYKLTFDDEFNTRSISQTGAGTTWADIRPEWRYDANSDIGFGHSSFVDAASGYNPFSVANGALTITAVPDKTASGYPGSWESGLITTQGHFSQTYGYFEIRADFSALKGAWDGFWLMPVTPQADPNNAGHWQELDVVEHYGSNDKGVYSTIHTTDAAPNQNWQQYLQVYSELTSSPGYHTYGMDWEADKISFYVDGHLVGSQATPSDMHGPMYLLADLATQADANNANVPISSSIDYIRAYSSAADAVAVTQDTVSAPDGNDPGTYGAIDSTAASVARLYFGVLDRAPDDNGLQYWVNIAKAGTSLAKMANDFLRSDEYERHTTGLTDHQFVDAMYTQVLGRAGDSGGLQFWDSNLDQGGTRSEVANAFADSLEFQSKYINQSNEVYVEGLYEHILGRQSDSSGEQYWSAVLNSHTLDRIDVALAFTGCDEFQQKFVAPSDAAFVDNLYVDALGRHAEAAGLQIWTSALSHGTSRADVALAITQSAEAQIHVTDSVDQGWHFT